MLSRMVSSLYDLSLLQGE